MSKFHTIDKLLIARWIAGCDDITAEIEYILDKAYPDGAEERFYSDYKEVFKREDSYD